MKQTRQRWDRIFLPGIVCALILSYWVHVETRRVSAYGVPLFIVGLWLWFRTKNRKEGVEVKAISEMKGMVPLVIHSGICFILMFVILIVRGGFKSSFTAIDWILWAALYGVMWGGIFLIRKRYRI